MVHRLCSSYSSTLTYLMSKSLIIAPEVINHNDTQSKHFLVTLQYIFKIHQFSHLIFFIKHFFFTVSEKFTIEKAFVIIFLCKCHYRVTRYSIRICLFLCLCDLERKGRSRFVMLLLTSLVNCLRNALDHVTVLLVGFVNDFEQDAFRSAVSVEALDMAD